jgi:subtilase family serine protease
MSTIISAQAILKSSSGRSMTDASEITAQNIDEFRPSRETLEQVIREFKNLGFDVLPDGITITITGDLKLFEQVFKVKITQENIAGGDRSIKSNNDPVLPKSLRQLVEKVVFVPPPEYYSQ